MRHNKSETVVTRRRLLQAVGGASMMGLAGCIADGGSTTNTPTEPISLGGGKQCDACGMVIGQHAGPNAMAFYRDNSPEGHDNPARFDSVSEMVEYDAGRRRTGWERVVAYVTDYSSVEYEVTTRKGTKRISSHVEPESFVEATEATYVAGSDVMGAMSGDFLPFTDADEAAAFADEHGGTLVEFEGLLDARSSA